MTTLQAWIIVGITMLGTMVTRFLPFLLFPAGKPAPKYIRYLGTVLPAAALGLLVIYCLKDVSLLSGSHGLPELIALALVTILQCRWHNLLLSVGAGTLCYMALLQWVF